MSHSMEPNVNKVENHETVDEIINQVNDLQQMVHDSLDDLNFEHAFIQQAASFIPDARKRLDYVVQMTAQAANRALNAIDIARPLQEELDSEASKLNARWDAWFENPIELTEAKQLVTDTRKFLAHVPQNVQQTNTQLLDIMMAQDFQDLTGQVIKKMVRVIQNIEKQLLFVLAEHSETRHEAAKPPLDVNAESDDGLLNGPQINPNKTDIVVSQEQVDDLLKNLYP